MEMNVFCIHTRCKGGIQLAAGDDVEDLSLLSVTIRQISLQQNALLAYSAVPFILAALNEHL